MASESKASFSVGVGFMPLLGPVFIILKLCGVIHWSWWLVTLPLWGGAVLGVALVLLVLLVVFGVALAMGREWTNS